MTASKRLLVVWIVWVLALAALFVPRSPAASKPAADIPDSAGFFIENVGQFGPGARFLQLDGQGGVWIATDSIWLTRFPGEDSAGVHLRLRFEGANPSPTIEPFNRLGTHVSYLKGIGPSGWQVDVPVWGGLRYVDLYPGIDLVLDRESFGWRLEVDPGANIDQVRLTVEGADRVAAQTDSLLVSSSAGDVVIPRIVVAGDVAAVEDATVSQILVNTESEGLITVDGLFQKSGIIETGAAEIQTAEGVKWATYLGGGENDAGLGIDVNASQDIFITGESYSTDFPVTPGAFDPTNTDKDAFVARLNSSGSTLIYATYLGGSNIDAGREIAVEGTTAFVVGETYSLDFPLVGAELAGGSDAFIASLNATGTSVNYIKLHGGSENDYGYGVDVESGYAYITGTTYSNDIPGGPVKGGVDGFAAKFNPAGTRIYAAVFGGRNVEGAFDLKVSGGNAFIVGETDSGDMGAGYVYDYDAFVIKLGASGEKIYTKLLGGTGSDIARGVAVDGEGRAVVVGQSGSTDLPVTEGSPAGGTDAFVAVLSAAGDTWSYAAFLGGAGADAARSVVVDNFGGIQLTGQTSSSDFPLTADAVQSSLGGAQDAFITRFDLAGADPGHRVFSSYFGGTGSEDANDMALDIWGYTYLAGETASSDFPVTAGVVDSSLGGAQDAFIVKLGVGPTPGVVVKKYTNGFDADLAPGPSLPVGSSVQWSYNIVNTGASALDSVQLNDNVLGAVSCPSSTLAAGASMTCTASGLAQTGQYSNIGTVSANPTGGLPPVTSSDASHYFGANPSISVVKRTNDYDANTPPGPSILAGAEVIWSYEVTNTGNVSLASVTVTDSDETVIPSCPKTALAALESMTCYASDFAQAGQYSNTGTVTGDPPDDLPQVSDTDPSHYYGVGPGLDVEKFVSVDNGGTWVDADSASGPTLLNGYTPHFKVVVTNSGDVPLSSLTVSDSDFNLSSYCSFPTSLAVSASSVCETIAPAWTAGQHEDEVTAQASYTDGLGNQQTVTGKDKAYYFGVQTGIDVTKEVSIDGGSSWSDANAAPGAYLLAGYQAPSYRFTVKNTGNTALSNVTLSDPLVTITPGCASGGLQANDGLPGGADERSCVVTGVWAAGQHTNTVTASSSYTDSAGHAASLTDTDAANYFGAAPAISVEKQVSVNGGAAWQDADTGPGPSLLTGYAAPKFKLTVTNTGNVPLTGLLLSDSDFSTAGCTIPGSLAPLGSYTCTIDGVWAAGQHADTAAASGEFTDSAAHSASPGANDLAQYFGAAPALDIVKYVSLDGGATWDDANAAPGAALAQTGPAPQFKFTAKNTGNVSLNVSLSDSRVTLPAECHSRSLAANDGLPAGPDEFECVYSGAWSAGAQTNTVDAAASFTDSAGNILPVNHSDSANYFGAFTGLNVIKEVSDDGGATWQDANSAPGPYLAASGPAPRFRFTVKNTGNVSLTVLLTDNMISLPAECAPGMLQPNDGLSGGSDEHVCTVQTTWAAGQQSNTAAASASYTDSKGQAMNAADSDAAYYFGATPSIQLQKLTNGQDVAAPEDLYVLAGSTVTWTFSITNNGNVPLTGISLVDDNGTPGIPDDDFEMSTGIALGSGQSMQFTNSGPAVEGAYENIAYTTAYLPDESPVSSSDASAYFGAHPAVSIVKSVSGDGGDTWQDANEPPGLLVPIGTPLQWRYVLTNEGNVDLTDVQVVDDQGVTVACPRTTLDYSGPKKSMTCTASGTAEAGPYTNTGTVSAVPPGGLAEVSDSDTCNDYGYDPAVKAMLTLTTNGIWGHFPPGVYVLSGSTVTWTYSVINLLPTELTSVTVWDDHGTPGNSADDQAVCIIESLSSGAGQECTWSQTAVEGQYGNTAVLKDAGGNAISNLDQGYYFGVRPGISIEKRISSDGQTWFDADVPPGPVIPPGRAITWSYLITNTSNVTVSRISLTDDQEGAVSCPLTVLPPGQSTVCLLNGTSAPGQYSNIGTVSAATPGELAEFTASDACHFTGEAKLYLPVVKNYPFNVTKPTVWISPTSGTPGTLITVAAAGFPANQNVDIDLGRSGLPPAVIKDGRTDAYGYVYTTITLPVSAKAGELWYVTVHTTDLTPNISAKSQAFTVR